jgi:hypothetical protein
MHCYQTLELGIQAQYDYIFAKASGTASYYKIGSKPDALGGETYDGSLYQYLRIYSEGAQTSNAYLNYVVTYFHQQGYPDVTPHTKMSDIIARN